MTLHRPHTAEELTYFASQMRVADPNVDNGSFSSLTTKETMEWIMVVGHINEISPRFKQAENAKRQHGIASDDLRVLLWDMQRFDYLFPEARYSLRPNFDIMRLESWPQWKTPHRNVLRNVSVSPQKTTTVKSLRWEQMNSLVVTNFNLLAFSPNDLAYGHFTMPPEGMFGNWIGAKKIMCHASLDITERGGEIPFLVYFHEDTLMIMEVLDVKRVSWPDPGRGRFFQKLVENQESKYGPYEGGPLAPALETPKVPLVLIRYSYTEGRPKGGSKFMPYLESRLRDRLPPGTSNDNIRLELEKHILAGQQVPEEHLLMFARLLSYNSGLVDKSWADSLQLDPNIPEGVRETTHISFFVPCLRPRFRIIEEIETGLSAMPMKVCGECKKKTMVSICRTCNSVFYCGEPCARKHWPQHKRHCRISKKLPHEPTSLPRGTLYVPLRASSHWVADFGFASEQEAIRMGSPLQTQCPINEYGTERFICRAIMESEMEAQKVNPGKELDFFTYADGVALVYDRRRSVLARFGRDEHRKAREQGSAVPFHDAKYDEFSEVVMEHGFRGHSVYLWARRVGDCIEIDLEDIPEQSRYHWN